MSQLKQLGAMTRLNIRLQLTDPAPTLILTVIPLVLIPFMMPAFKSMLLADGYAGVTGAEQAVPSIAILNEGRIVASGTLEEIISSHGRAEVTLEFDRTVASFDGWDADGTLLRHIGDEADPGSRFGEALASPTLQGARLTDVRIMQASLHNAYLQIIKESDHVAA